MQAHLARWICNHHGSPWSQHSGLVSPLLFVYPLAPLISISCPSSVWFYHAPPFL